MITRIWSANAAGTIRIYLDGSPKPEIEEDFKTFLQRMPLASGRGTPKRGTPEFEKVLADREALGNTVYCVIPFNKGCRVTLADTPAVYYQFNYLLFDAPHGHGLPTYSAEWHTSIKKKQTVIILLAASTRDYLNWEPSLPRCPKDIDPTRLHRRSSLIGMPTSLCEGAGGTKLARTTL